MYLKGSSDIFKPIIPILIGLSYGRGDWIHGLEIAKNIKKKFGDKYRIFGFPTYVYYNSEVNPRMVVLNEIKKFSDFMQLEVSFNVKEDTYINFKLKDNEYFDYLFPVNNKFSINNQKNGCLEFQSFLRDNDIFCVVKVSYINACYELTKETIKNYGLNYPIIYLPEYGEVLRPIRYGYRYDFCYPVDLQYKLFMGFSDRSQGIRIYDNTQEDFYWQKLENQAEELFKGLLIHVNKDYKKYHQIRKLLPGDLRSTKAILEFIEIGLINYGAKCDFYLPKELVGSILFNDDPCASAMQDPTKVVSVKNIFNDLKLFKEICAKYGIKQYRYITPGLDPSDLTSLVQLICFDDANIDPTLNNNEIRIFSGFNLSDEVYKGLYLYNRGAGVGISGDDGWSLAISGGNLPFIDMEGWQKNVVNSMCELTKKLNLTILDQYFTILSKDSVNLFKLKKLFNDPETKQLLTTQYAILVEYVKKEMNIYDKLEEQIISLQKLKMQNNNFLDKKILNKYKYPN